MKNGEVAVAVEVTQGSFLRIEGWPSNLECPTLLFFISELLPGTVNFYIVTGHL